MPGLPALPASIGSLSFFASLMPGHNSAFSAKLSQSLQRLGIFLNRAIQGLVLNLKDFRDFPRVNQQFPGLPAIP